MRNYQRESMIPLECNTQNQPDEDSRNKSNRITDQQIRWNFQRYKAGNAPRESAHTRVELSLLNENQKNILYRAGTTTG